MGVDVTVPLTTPPEAAPVAPSLIGFSLEQDRFTDWVGLNSRNLFFFNVLNNLKSLSGTSPFIRIGANSEDHTNFNPNVQVPQLIFPAPSTTMPYPEALNVTVGDAYYQAAQFLPPDTHVVWGVNFGDNNLTAASLEAKAIVKAFSSSAVKSQGIVLDAIEIGNEPDLYLNNGHRAQNYTSTQYVEEWTAFATNVSAVAGITSTSSTQFWGASFAGSSHSTNGFSPQAIFNEGLLNSTTGSFISTISQHHYSGSFCSGSEGLLQDLMTKATIRGNLTIFAPDAKAVRAQGLDYVLGETNSYSCHGAPGVSNVAGAALWSLDYALFSTQIQSSRIFFHEGIGFKYNFIQPVTLTRSTTDATTLPSPLPPHIQPQYYAAIVANEAIGSSGKTRIAELTIDDPNVAGYAFYEGSSLSRAVFINSRAFLQSSPSRSLIHVDLTFADGSARSATLKRLAIPHADDTSGLTWGGQTYETSDGKVSGSSKRESVDLKEGFDIQDTEAVLVSFTL
ncbi:glycoside hydrolase family 79 protein [Macrolepiota fuliginosa MF-IS2]|uniref:Glycoside hydrolase family 79 protein n=1 Tax=Macrolepiota fuliginosa MF-IS2 TaxID=1400762 RepID=A0A9P5X860_9AGAR|nr:glycoside hydrolase family 79 protein [Macrolepiota fuliginosa MF-IS2]